MKSFFAILIVWCIFALGPILVLTGLFSFSMLDPSLFNPMNWNGVFRFTAGLWTILSTVFVIQIILEERGVL